MVATMEIYDRKEGKNVLKRAETNETIVYKYLAGVLVNRYLEKSNSVTRIVRINNYDGTQSIKVYLNNAMMWEFTVPERI